MCAPRFSASEEREDLNFMLPGWTLRQDGKTSMQVEPRSRGIKKGGVIKHNQVPGLWWMVDGR